MSYFTYFNLQREPFSTTPDPAFFYLSKTHTKALSRLEISIRLKRGLNIVLGDIGSGKTTMARTLLNRFGHNEPFDFFLITDPGNNSQFQFLQSLVDLFKLSPRGRSTFEFKNCIKNFLFNKNISEGITPVVIIDEGQKLTSEFLEILRIFLNYETNDFKMLQLIILGQLELVTRIKNIHNFADRIALKTILEPLDFEDTKSMILFRLKTAGCNAPEKIINNEAIERIYSISQGLPRKVTYYCSEALMSCIMNGKTSVDTEVLNDIIEREKKWQNSEPIVATSFE